MTNFKKTKPLKNSPTFTLRDFQETLDGGQAFRWQKISEDSYEGVFDKFHTRLSLDKSGKILVSIPENSDENKLLKAVENYLDSERDYQQIVKLQCDQKVLNAAKEFPTLRILRQKPSEAIVCFICSSSKRIVQIKQCVRLLAENLGERISENAYATPSFEAIANADDKILKDCKLGFRASYLKKTAQKILNDKFETDCLCQMPYNEAKKYLLTLSGIGEKVADCILLFGAAKFEAFPVDTWISKTMSELYGLENPKLTREFAAKRFGAHAGYVQQVLFSSIRAKQK